MAALTPSILPYPSVLFPWLSDRSFPATITTTVSGLPEAASLSWSPSDSNHGTGGFTSLLSLHPSTTNVTAFLPAASSAATSGANLSATDAAVAGIGAASRGNSPELFSSVAFSPFPTVSSKILGPSAAPPPQPPAPPPHFIDSFCQPQFNGSWASITNELGAFTPCFIDIVVLGTAYLAMILLAVLRLYVLYTTPRAQQRAVAPGWRGERGIVAAAALALTCAVVPLMQLSARVSLSSFFKDADLPPYEVCSLILAFLAWALTATALFWERRRMAVKGAWLLRFAVLYVMVGQLAKLRFVLILQQDFQAFFVELFFGYTSAHVLLGLLALFFFPTLLPLEHPSLGLSSSALSPSLAPTLYLPLFPFLPPCLPPQVLLGLLALFFFPSLLPLEHPSPGPSSSALSPLLVPPVSDVWVDDAAHGHGVPCFETSQPPAPPPPCPYPSFSPGLTFGWMTPLMATGYRRPLEDNDVWRLNDGDRTATVYGRFERVWREEEGRPKPWLLRALHSCFGRRFWWGGFCKIGNDASQFVGPLMLSRLLSAMQSDEPAWHGYIYATIIFLGLVGGVICEAQYFQNVMRVGFQLRQAMGADEGGEVAVIVSRRPRGRGGQSRRRAGRPREREGRPRLCVGRPRQREGRPRLRVGRPRQSRRPATAPRRPSASVAKAGRGSPSTVRVSAKVGRGSAVAVRVSAGVVGARALAVRAGAQVGRGSALAERVGARGDRGRALAERVVRDSVLVARDGALVVRDGTLVVRDGALVVRDGALVVRDGALIHPPIYSSSYLAIPVRPSHAQVAAVFSKSLRLSHSGRQGFSTGRITNMMTNDAESLQMVCQQLHGLWSAPLRILVCIFLLYQQLGVASVLGLLMLLLMILAQAVIVNRVQKLVKASLQRSDKRVALMSEMLAAMDVVKLYTWEESFQSKVARVRADEMGQISKAQYIMAVGCVRYDKVEWTRWIRLCAV
ncbi:unnamed protein product [Closterium sp. Yama58-4]|nr:unnamed protein product [Closterium sp. Yama58-4]